MPERAKGRAQWKMLSDSATCCWVKAGNRVTTCATSGLKAPSITKRRGRSVSGRFCNFCFRGGKDGYNPRSFSGAIQGLRVSPDRATTILCVSSYEKGQEF